jgi:hypothetical protein
VTSRLGTGKSQTFYTVYQPPSFIKVRRQPPSLENEISLQPDRMTSVTIHKVNVILSYESMTWPPLCYELSYFVCTCNCMRDYHCFRNLRFKFVLFADTE